MKPLVGAVVLALCGLIVALALSWLLLAQFNFSYGFWHDHAGIGAAIERFAPNNHHRDGFHLTTREQRLELFAGINEAIHQGGDGLAELTYQVPGHPQQSLLREPEIVHLTDVANLISAARILVGAVALIWLGQWVYYWQSRQSPPSLSRQLLGTVAFVALTGLVVVLVGPVKIFYALHIWLFPKDHQWFFYYEDSLMSTMMLAPDLFGWIAVEWTLLAIAFFVVLQIGAAQLVVALNSHSGGIKRGAEAPRKGDKRTKKMVN